MEAQYKVQFADRVEVVLGVVVVVVVVVVKAAPVARYLFNCYLYLVFIASAVR